MKLATFYYFRQFNNETSINIGHFHVTFIIKRCGVARINQDGVILLNDEHKFWPDVDTLDCSPMSQPYQYQFNEHLHYVKQFCYMIYLYVNINSKT